MEEGCVWEGVEREILMERLRKTDDLPVFLCFRWCVPPGSGLMRVLSLCTINFSFQKSKGMDLFSLLLKNL